MAAAAGSGMPSEHRLVNFFLEGYSRYTFTFDLELDLSDPALSKNFPLTGVPLAGAWACACRRWGEDVHVSISWGGLSMGTFGQRVAYGLQLYWLDESAYPQLLGAYQPTEYGPEPKPDPGSPTRASCGQGMALSPLVFDSAMAASGGKYDVKTHRSYRFVFNLESLGSEHLAAHYNSFKQEIVPALSPTPYEVRLVFPAYGAEMWIESGFLSQASSYFKTLLSADFAETAAVTSKYSEMRLTPSTSSVSQDRLALTASSTKRFIRKTGVLIPHSSMSRARDLHATISDRRTAASEADFDYFDDSDDETDELYFAHHPPQQHSLDVLQLAYKEIKVTKTAFTTYRAVLACLRMGYIAFAPLWSTFFYSTSEQARSRRSYIEAIVGRAPPTHPYPVSPKSAFRLAHLLELEPLQRLCLANLKTQLTIECAPYELFSEMAVCYNTWRKVVLDFVIDNWDAVTASTEWKETEGEIKRNEIDGAAPIMLELLERREGKAV
ncbi:hypothetical protein RTBOTA2_005565 [Rhodotorula toruloides]|uniref:FGENESH: predicted gene_11.67 protein n=1 Tax=Rhodotorula toruloides TaxID=5286 RepID=A0A0K3CML6_RHOTO|nr:hypothetical protein RTBOTA2_005565 [Rhodotorula toruloides]PRQ71652.1 hypothetical protein AAT19DRAFT_9767 [Rhodotorula toruloides]